ncbi:MAG: hypothetical protein GY810_18200 [Aureispira sp.]|nr:hypothetical protein [Aureispira sp.]
MLNSKLVQLYKTLTKQEIRLLKQWIYSPVHNQHKDVQKLFEFLFSRRSIRELTVQKKKAFEYLYSNKSYDDLRIRHVMSFALKTLEDFVSYYAAFDSKLNYKKNLTKAYRNHNLPLQASLYLEKTAKELNKSTIQNELFYLDKYTVEVNKFELEGTQDRTRAINVQDIDKQATIFYIITTLKYASTSLSHSALVKTDYEFSMLQAVLDEVTTGKYDDVPVVMLYYYSYMALTTPEKEEYFQKLNHYINHNLFVLPHNEQRSIYSVAINYCIKRLNTGTDKYIRLAFDLYKNGLANGILIENQTLSHFAYKNTVALGLHLKEFDWVTNFINNYSSYLQESHRQNYEHYNTAKLHFAKKEYNLAIELIAQVEYDDLLLTMDAKMMLLIIYYEQGSFQALDALLDSFRVFIHRKKVMGYHKANYLNLISMTKKLMQLPIYSKEEKLQLQKQIEETKPLAGQKWLLEQLDKKR